MCNRKCATTAFMALSLLERQQLVTTNHKCLVPKQAKSAYILCIDSLLCHFRYYETYICNISLYVTFSSENLAAIYHQSHEPLFNLQTIVLPLCPIIIIIITIIMHDSVDSHQNVAPDSIEFIRFPWQPVELSCSLHKLWAIISIVSQIDDAECVW